MILWCKSVVDFVVKFVDDFVNEDDFIAEFGLKSIFKQKKQWKRKKKYSRARGLAIFSPGWYVPTGTKIDL